MAEPQKIRKTVAVTPPVPPRQMIITFESSVLQLTDPERAKALTHLAHLLLLAAGVVVEENNDER
jgi:hypothetical protein